MYSQSAQRKGNSAKLDFVLLFIFIIVVFFARKLSTLAAALSAPYNIVVQIALLGAIVAVLLWVYEKRICSFRYTIVHGIKEDTAVDKNAEGDAENEIKAEREPLPYKIGTLLFERMVADKGKIVECVSREEVIELLKPGEAHAGEGIPFLRAGSLSINRPDESYTLIFKRGGKLHSLSFAPDEQFVAYFDRVFVAQAQNEGEKEGEKA